MEWPLSVIFTQKLCEKYPWEGQRFASEHRREDVAKGYSEGCEMAAGSSGLKRERHYYDNIRQSGINTGMIGWSVIYLSIVVSIGTLDSIWFPLVWLGSRNHLVNRRLNRTCDAPAACLGVLVMFFYQLGVLCVLELLINRYRYRYL